MKKTLKNILRGPLETIEKKISQRVTGQQSLIHSSNAGISQRLLTHHYQNLLLNHSPLPLLSSVGWKECSQTDEDGILHYIFSICGTTNKRCVEVCASNGRECNTANLLLNHQWIGLLIDGNEGNVNEGREWFGKHPATYCHPPKFECRWVTRDSINSILSGNGFSGEIDLLSIDLDGVDYWIWKALGVISPRVVVIEFQSHLGPERSITVPYADDFSGWQHGTTNGCPNYAGASLRALTRLGEEKGYRLVGVNHLCFNAFFIRNDVGPEAIPAVPVESCFSHPRAAWALENRWKTVSNLEWVDV